ncbi:MAG: HAMP domain-containing histidine kinase [Roseomonas sp.]|nr:HAMP domain-containing histidine kinase [Roseomonas sp.]
MKLRSIRQRILARVLLVQLALGAAGLLVVAVFARFVGEPEIVATMVLAPAVSAAIPNDGAGHLALDCEGQLARRLRADPGFWVYAWQEGEKSGCNAPASAISLAQALAAGFASGQVVVPAGADHGPFILEKRLEGLSLAVGATQASLRDKAEFLLSLLLDHVLAVLLLPFAGFLLALAAVPKDIRMALSHLSAHAAATDPTGKGLRLDLDLAPPEARGLVNSFNILLDRVQELSSRQRRFLADLAHEMRTPLAIMRLRLDDLPASKTRASLVLDLDRLGGRIEALLALARLRAGAPAPERLDLADLARDIVMDRAPRAAAAGCDLAMEAPSAALMRADRALVETALANLVDNAIAHAGAGACIVVRVPGPGIIEVVDDGLGIPADRRDDVLKPFVRESGGGQLGLGLALVSEAVKAMGGVLELAETPGGGMTARIRLS